MERCNSADLMMRWCMENAPIQATKKESGMREVPPLASESQTARATTKSQKVSRGIKLLVHYLGWDMCVRSKEHGVALFCSARQ